MNIYVGNLSFQCSEDDLRQLFSQYGDVSSAKLVTDRYTNKPRGFAFVEMPDNSQAQAAIAALNGTDHLGRTLKVSEASPREDRRPPRDRDRGRD